MKEVSRLPDLDITGCPPPFYYFRLEREKIERSVCFDTAVLVEGANIIPSCDFYFFQLDQFFQLGIPGFERLTIATT